MHEPPPEAAGKTYLYLRVGLLSAALFLAFSVLTEIVEYWSTNDAFCLQSSISGYYYTRVRAVFAGSLLMVSAALVAIQGDDGVEDLWLTLAGMLAPIVALVPTTNVGLCPSIGTDLDAALAGVTNNILSLLIIGCMLWVFAGILLKAFNRTPPGVRNPLNKVVKQSWWVVGGVLLVFSIWFGLSRFRVNGFSQEFFNRWAHNAAAILMFVFLFFAAALSAKRCDVVRYKKHYRRLARAMVVLAAIVLTGALTTKWKHAVFTLEAGEIFIFATYWIIQTHEHRPTPGSQPTPVEPPKHIWRTTWSAVRELIGREPTK